MEKAVVCLLSRNAPSPAFRFWSVETSIPKHTVVLRSQLHVWYSLWIKLHSLLRSQLHSQLRSQHNQKIPQHWSTWRASQLFCNFSRNYDKMSSTFERKNKNDSKKRNMLEGEGILVLVLLVFIFSIWQSLAISKWNFEIWAVRSSENLVDREKINAECVY